MKKFAIISLFLFFCSNVYAQEIRSTFVSESAAGMINTSRGVVLKKEIFWDKPFSNTLLTSGITISPALITVLSSEEKIPYVIIGSTFSSGINTSEYSSYIDLEDLPNCIGALEYIIDSELKTKPSHYVECLYKSRDGLAIGAVYGDGLFGKRWMTYVKHEKYISDTTTWLSIDRFREILDALKAAMDTLIEKM